MGQHFIVSLPDDVNKWTFQNHLRSLVSGYVTRPRSILVSEISPDLVKQVHETRRLQEEFENGGDATQRDADESAMLIGDDLYQLFTSHVETEDE